MHVVAAGYFHRKVDYRCGHSLVLGLFERVELLFLAAQLRRLGKDSASYKRPSLMYLP